MSNWYNDDYRKEDPGDIPPYPRSAFRLAKLGWMPTVVVATLGSVLTASLILLAIWYPDPSIGGKIGATAGFLSVALVIIGFALGCFAESAPKIRRKYLNWVQAKTKWDADQALRRERENQEFLKRMEQKALNNTPEPDLFGLREHPTIEDLKY